MNLTSPSQVKAWCIENGFHPNKVLGQNFLIDRNALEAIVDAGVGEGIEKVGRESRSTVEGEEKVEVGGVGVGEGVGGVRVLEIGPGLGVLTEEMLRRGCSVVAIEKDPVLAERLEREMKGEGVGVGFSHGERGGHGELERVVGVGGRGVGVEFSHGERGEHGELERVVGVGGRVVGVGVESGEWLRVIEGDALEVIANPAAFGLAGLAEFDCMVSNLPYQAGTRILLELIKRREIAVMTVLVQTEVAERLAAKEGTKTRGLAGVWAQLDYEVKIVRKVAASCFWPRPEVGSSVVKLVRHERNAGLSQAERRIFHSLTKTAFEHRRKQLGTVFRNLIQSTLRAEELTNEEWVELARSVKFEK